ncbi:HpcH/HpaI aldolase/citrate lyase family protein [Camelimonas abortus]|uniref:HpcH/HpaI aldolase family protein n=1 Tax=Camelimonas abortus TaxID=1017184 RepID=UPI0035EC8C43
MSVYEQFAARLAGGAPVFSAWIGMGGSQVASVLARSAFDAATFDMQHGVVDFAAVVRGTQLSLAAGKPPVARVPVGACATAARLLDAGVAAIIAPMVNSAGDARQFVSFCKFPSVGGRSWGPGESRVASGLDSAGYLARANSLLKLFVMVETREALAALDEILAVDGVDGVFVGPADLSIALSGGARVDPAGVEVDAALAQVVARCRAAGKTPCVYAVTARRARALAEMGFVFIAVSSDGALLRAAADAAAAEARGETAGPAAGGYG